MQVAPYVGAWIETRWSDIRVRAQKSHPTWVRGLKLDGVEQRSFAVGRTLRGCVD